MSAKTACPVVKCERQATSAQNMQISPIMQSYWTFVKKDKHGGYDKKT